MFNPSLSGAFNFSVTQPLLQNRSGIQFKAPLEIARTQLAITSRQSEAHIADLVATAAGQYWDAVRARDNIKVQQQTLDLAQKSYDRDKQALDLGALANLDIFQSETQVAQRKTDLVQAEYGYRAALDGLRRLIGADLTPATARGGDCSGRRPGCSCLRKRRCCRLKRRSRRPCVCGRRWMRRTGGSRSTI